MKVKVGMRVLNSFYGVGGNKTRILFSEILGSDALSEFTEKYGTLERLAEARDADLLNMPGISDEVLAQIKSTVQAYYNRLIKWDTLTGMPEDVCPSERICWGKLMEASTIYGVSIKKLSNGLSKLSKKERKYLKLRFGLNEKRKFFSLARISKELDMPVSELDDFEVKSLNNFTQIMLSNK